jgi:hypothetical protein
MNKLLLILVIISLILNLFLGFCLAELYVKISFVEKMQDVIKDKFIALLDRLEK